MKLNKYIDHTKLNQTALRSDYDDLINEAKSNSFFSVCVPPFIVTHAKDALKNSDVKICSVASFPNGYSTIENKKNEIDQLFKIGCDEVDVVLNISNVKSGDWKSVQSEFEIFTEISKIKILKVIIESGMLTKTEVIKVCGIANRLPVSFLKTSTGFATKSASIEAVMIIREHLDSNIKIKASGGIRNYEQAEAFINAGADRLGCSASVNIVSNKGEQNGNISTSSY